MSQYGLFDEYLQRAAQSAQAQARPARVRLHVVQSGVGEIRKELSFGTMILEEPTFSWGAVMVTEVPKGSIPLTNAVVLEYQTNNLGFYIGAEVGFILEGPVPNLDARFTLTFEGVALRAANQAMQ